MIGVFHGQNPQQKEWDQKKNIGKSKELKSCLSTGSKKFWAVLNFLCKTKKCIFILCQLQTFGFPFSKFSFCASTKLIGAALNEIQFMPCPFTGHKMFCASPNFISRPKLYIPSTPNNSNVTHTFMCLGRTGRFGRR